MRRASLNKRDMDRNTIILILSTHGTRVRRFTFTRKSARDLLSVGAVVIAISGLLLGDYLWLRPQRKGLKGMSAEAQAEQQRLSALHERSQEIHRLLMSWKGLREKIQASLPSQQRSSRNGTNPVEDLENNLTLLKGELEHLIASVPMDWPANGRVTSGVGLRASPWTGEAEFHSGLDIPNPTGTPIYAPANGIVDFVGESNGNGRNVVLNHGQGITTQYAHLSKAHVKKGDGIRKGQHIANVGSTGKSTSPHLHYEVRIDGVPIDPRRHLLK